MRVLRHLDDAMRGPKEVFAGRFTIEREAGAGGMSVVYRALDQIGGQLVALKIYGGRDSTAAFEAFSAEVRALEQLKHPAVVRYVTHGVNAEREAYLATEWIEGETLYARLRRGPLDLSETIALGLRLADALACAHALGLVHRDIKPGNVLLPAQDVREAKLIDFGLARSIRSEATRATVEGASGEHESENNGLSTGMIVGTPGYMAPEQAQGRHEVNGRSDLFSLGCVLFRCLTGTEAFQETSELTALAKVVLFEPSRVSELRPGIPAVLDHLVTRLLSKNPEERPASAVVVGDELTHIGADLSAARLESTSEARTMKSAADLSFGRYVLADPATSTDNVVLAQDRVIGRRVALRTFGSVRDRTTIAQLLEKARTAAVLNHPNIAAIYDVGEHAGIPFVAREYVDGKVLREYIGESSVDLDQRVRWLRGIARGLAAAHRAGVIHGNVNPNNVIVGDTHSAGDGSDNGIKVLDFGLAFAGYSANISAYMAPELIRGEAPDGRTDQFAWGVICYELLIGHLPWSDDGATGMRQSGCPGRTVRRETASKLDTLPWSIAGVILRAMHEDHEKRFSTMDTLLGVLERNARKDVSDAVDRALFFNKESKTPDGHFASVAFAPFEKRQWPRRGERPVARLRPVASEGIHAKKPEKRSASVFVARAFAGVLALLFVMMGGHVFVNRNRKTDADTPVLVDLVFELPHLWAPSTVSVPSVREAPEPSYSAKKTTPRSRPHDVTDDEVWIDQLLERRD